MAKATASSAPLPPGAEPSFRDGLGLRYVVTDPETGDRLERLRVPAEIARHLQAVEDRASRLLNFRHARFPRVRGVEAERLQDGTTIGWVIAEPVQGIRVIDLLRLAEQSRLTIDINTVLQLAREVFPALATLHDSRDVTHGALGPERLVMTPQGRVLIADHVFGAALAKLQYPRVRLWRDFRIAMPPAAGVPRFDARADVGMVAMIVLALLVGRPITLNEYPDHLRDLLDRARERLSTGPDRAITASLRAWLERALPVDTRKPFTTALDAQVALEAAIKKERAYAPGATAIKHFLDRVAPVLAEVNWGAPVATHQDAEAAPAPANAADIPGVVPPAAPAGRRGGRSHVRRLTPEEEEAEEIAFLEQELARIAAEEAAGKTPDAPAPVAADSSEPVAVETAAPAVAEEAPVLESIEISLDALGEPVADAPLAASVADDGAVAPVGAEQAAEVLAETHPSGAYVEVVQRLDSVGVVQPEAIPEFVSEVVEFATPAAAPAASTPVVDDEVMELTRLLEQLAASEDAAAPAELSAAAAEVASEAGQSALDVVDAMPEAVAAAPEAAVAESAPEAVAQEPVAQEPLAERAERPEAAVAAPSEPAAAEPAAAADADAAPRQADARRRARTHKPRTLVRTAPAGRRHRPAPIVHQAPASELAEPESLAPVAELLAEPPVAEVVAAPAAESAAIESPLAEPLVAAPVEEPVEIESPSAEPLAAAPVEEPVAVEQPAAQSPAEWTPVAESLAAESVAATETPIAEASPVVEVSLDAPDAAVQAIDVAQADVLEPQALETDALVDLQEAVGLADSRAVVESEGAPFGLQHEVSGPLAVPTDEALVTPAAHALDAVVEVLSETPRRFSTSPVVEFVEFSEGGAVDLTRELAGVAADASTDAVFEPILEVVAEAEQAVEVEPEDAWRLTAPEDGVAAEADAAAVPIHAEAPWRDEHSLWLDFERMHASALLAADIVSREEAGVPVSVPPPSALVDAAQRAVVLPLGRAVKPIGPLVAEERRARRRGRKAKPRRSTVVVPLTLPERTGAVSGALALAAVPATLNAVVAAAAPILSFAAAVARRQAAAVPIAIAERSVVAVEGPVGLACCVADAFQPGYVEFREPVAPPATMGLVDEAPYVEPVVEPEPIAIAETAPVLDLAAAAADATAPAETAPTVAGESAADAPVLVAAPEPVVQAVVEDVAAVDQPAAEPIAPEPVVLAVVEDIAAVDQPAAETVVSEKVELAIVAPLVQADAVGEPVPAGHVEIAQVDELPAAALADTDAVASVVVDVPTAVDAVAMADAPVVVDAPAAAGAPALPEAALAPLTVVQPEPAEPALAAVESPARRVPSPEEELHALIESLRVVEDDQFARGTRENAAVEIDLTSVVVMPPDAPAPSADVVADAELVIDPELAAALAEVEALEAAEAEARTRPSAPVPLVAAPIVTPVVATPTIAAAAVPVTPIVPAPSIPAAAAPAPTPIHVTPAEADAPATDAESQARPVPKRRRTRGRPKKDAAPPPVPAPSRAPSLVTPLSGAPRAPEPVVTPVPVTPPPIRVVPPRQVTVAPPSAAPAVESRPAASAPVPPVRVAPAPAAQVPVAPAAQVPPVLHHASPAIEATLPTYAPWLTHEPLPPGAAEAGVRPRTGITAVPQPPAAAPVPEPQPVRVAPVESPVARVEPPAPLPPSTGIRLAPAPEPATPSIRLAPPPEPRRDARTPVAAVQTAPPVQARDAEARDTKPSARTATVAADAAVTPEEVRVATGGGFVSSAINWRRTVAASVAVLVLSGVAFAAAYWYVRPPADGLLVVQSGVAGIEVLIDGRARGTTPLKVELPAGRHVIEMRGFGTTRTLPVEITAGVQTTQNVKWPTGNQSGTLRVKSTPPGARVRVDGEMRGVTPVELENVAVGSRTVILESDSGTVRKVVKVESGETTEVEAEVFSGWLTVFAPFSVKVFDNGTLLGNSDDGKMMLGCGSHKVEIIAERYGVKETRTVEISPGGTTALSFEAPMGTIEISGPEGTRVEIDGETRATLQQQPVRVQARVGTHNVHLFTPQGALLRPWDGLVVRADREVKIP